MKLFWASDIHLDVLSYFDNRDKQNKLTKFIDSIAELSTKHQDPVLIVTGDISNGDNIVRHLSILASAGVKTYFVLGNHDFYGSSFQKVRTDISQIGLSNLTYLTSSEPIVLDNETILVGVDGWYDARVGNPHSNFSMYNDWSTIKDYGYRNHDEMKYRRDEIIHLSRKFADWNAQELRRKLRTAISLNPKQIIVATHIPPIPAVSLYEGRMNSSDSGWYVSMSTFEAIRDYSLDNWRINFTVLSGHSHSYANCNFDRNLTFTTKAAVYGNPDFEELVL